MDANQHEETARARATDDRVAVVVVTRNRVTQLCETLPRHLGLPERPRVVVIDDASDDGTPETVRDRFPDVELISLSASRGAVARNLGLEVVGEPYVAFADDDAWFAPGALRQAAAVLDAHPRVALVNPQILVGAARRPDPACTEMARSPLPRGPGQPGHPLLGFLACSVIARRTALRDAGGFCERLGVGGEERLLSWDLVAAGWQLSYLPELVAYHCPPPARDRTGRQVQTLRNDLWVNWLRRPLARALRATVRDLRRARSARTSLHALAVAVLGASWVVRERRPCPAHVERLITLLESADA
jgi:GT2 family glycosyltransferase